MKKYTNTILFIIILVLFFSVIILLNQNKYLKEEITQNKNTFKNYGNGLYRAKTIYTSSIKIEKELLDKLSKKEIPIIKVVTEIAGKTLEKRTKAEIIIENEKTIAKTEISEKDYTLNIEYDLKEEEFYHKLELKPIILDLYITQQENGDFSYYLKSHSDLIQVKSLKVYFTDFEEKKNFWQDLNFGLGFSTNLNLEIYAFCSIGYRKYNLFLSGNAKSATLGLYYLF